MDPAEAGTLGCGADTDCSPVARTAESGTYSTMTGSPVMDLVFTTICSGLDPSAADGTKPETVDVIVEQGMDHRLSGGMLGQGTYFAEASSKSDQYVGTGRCFIFLARSVSLWLRTLHEDSLRPQGGARNPALHEQ